MCIGWLWNHFYISLFYMTTYFQAPGTPIIARQVTPTTIIKQVSQAQTTVQPTTTLQRSPGVQVRDSSPAHLGGFLDKVWIFFAMSRPCEFLFWIPS